MEYPAATGTRKEVGAGSEEGLNIFVGNTGVGSGPGIAGVFGNKHAAVCSTGEKNRTA